MYMSRLLKLVELLQLCGLMHDIVSPILVLSLSCNTTGERSRVKGQNFLRMAAINQSQATLRTKTLDEKSSLLVDVNHFHLFAESCTKNSVVSMLH